MNVLYVVHKGIRNNSKAYFFFFFGDKDIFIFYWRNTFACGRPNMC